VVEPDTEQVEFDLERDASAASRFAGEDGTVGEHAGRDPVAREPLAEAGQHLRTGGGEPDLEARSSREWSSTMFKISTPVPSRGSSR
jgi:hypothetical protein